MRYAILGNSGSGKSTLAKALAVQHSLAVLDLDTVAWEPGTVGVPRAAEAAAADVLRFCDAHDGFIVEGCYENLIEAAFAYRPRLVYLDPGSEVCERHCRARPYEPHKYTSPAAQNEQLAFLLSWLREHYTREGPMSHAAHVAAFERYDGPKMRYFAEVAINASGNIEPRAPVVFRRAAAADVPQILPLVEAYWGFEKIESFDAARVAGQLNRLLADDRLGSGWVAMLGDTCVGYLLLVYVFSLEHFGLTAEVDEIYVAPGQRERGIGASLLHEAERAARERACENISLQLGRDNAAGRRFYARLGYSPRLGYDLMDKRLEPGTAHGLSTTGSVRSSK